MKLISYINLNNEERLGVFYKDNVYDFSKAANEICVEAPHKMDEFLNNLPDSAEIAKKVMEALESNKIKHDESQGDLKIIAPVPHPTSCRDAYAFRQHVASARKNRGVDMIPEFDQFPVFYFTNHNAIIGPGDLVVEQDHLYKLDFELEVAAVIGKKGRNISASEADDYIFGYTIMNDFSARRLQMEEMKLNLGPAKGKDFATAIGPWLVTKDELEPYKIQTDAGEKFNLEMKAWHNGKQVSEGNVQDMTWTFAQILERVSYGVDLLPGDVIGSGTVGTGCYLELNGTNTRLAKEKGETFEPVWLENGDTIELEITGLGRLTNKIVMTDSGESILAKKKSSE